jgi:NitT/TauT family transport system ATP-binding protein
MVQPQYLRESLETVKPVVLEFDRVGLEYRVEGKPRRIIDEISLSIAEGEFVSFVGPSGCGKTSILRMVSGLALLQLVKLSFGGQR